MQTINKDSNDFHEIRSKGYVYLDKMVWFHRLGLSINGGEEMIFGAEYTFTFAILDEDGQPMTGS